VQEESENNAARLYVDAKNSSLLKVRRYRGWVGEAGVEEDAALERRRQRDKEELRKMERNKQGRVL